MRLIDEIVNTSSYLSIGLDDPIEFVGLSNDALDQITKEVIEEIKSKNQHKEDDFKISMSDIEDALTLKVLVMPGLFGIDYRFLKEVKFF